jgi:hypothetical protein
MLDEIAQAHHVSASQIGTYRLCPRKWGFEKLDGIKPPPGPYAERGTAVHGVLERWLDHGEPIDATTEYGKIAAAGLKFLPPPGTGLVEHMFRLVSKTAVYVGLWDLWEPAEVSEHQELAFPETVVTSRVHDHKTTSDFKWIKLIEELRKDPQANLYAISAAKMGAGVNRSAEEIHIELNWIYYRANEKRPGARKVQLHVLPEGMELPPRPADVLPEHYGSMDYPELADRFGELEHTASVLLDHRRQGRSGTDLEYNVDACNAFGGCPYRGDPCKLTMGQLIRGHMAQEDSLAERMSKAAAAKAEAGGNGASAPAATPTTPTAPAGDVDLGARMAAAAKADASPEAKAEASATTGAAAAQAQPAAVNPPESSKPVPPPQATTVAGFKLFALRDYFAGQAMQSLLTIPLGTDGESIAQKAYAQADAMLKVRGDT